MKRLLIKIAYFILRHNGMECLPPIYHNRKEYEVISTESHPNSDLLVIRAERKEK